MAEDLVEEMHRNGGLAPVDLDKFWEDNQASRDTFSPDSPQVLMGCILNGECVYAELGIEEDFWRYAHDAQWRYELNKAYNDKAEPIVGRRLLGESKPTGEAKPGFPALKMLHDVFEAKNEWHDQSWWLMQAADNEAELEALLDRVEERVATKESLRAFMLPENWEEGKARALENGHKLKPYRGQRGPVTFAASVYGSENLIMLILMNPDLAKRYSDLILKTILGLAEVIDEEAGYTPETAPKGWGWADDNCCLMTPEMYEFFAEPILKGVFDRYCPEPRHSRFQHSDSAMGHLLPILARQGLNGTNFGPTVMPDEQRKWLPKAVINGQLAPFTYSRNEHVNIVLEFLRDHEMTKESRGLRFATAGSINNGTRLTSMRLVMAAIQRYGRYE
jgi:uroporphyrinogen decarboxylase